MFFVFFAIVQMFARKGFCSICSGLLRRAGVFSHVVTVFDLTRDAGPKTTHSHAGFSRLHREKPGPRWPYMSTSTIVGQCLMRSSGRTTLTTALTWTPALTISHQHAPSGRRRSRRTGETFQTRKIDPNWQNCC